MNKEDKYTIGEISEILNIPKATIRYWEKEKLIKLSKNKHNNYREFNLFNLIDLSDLKFFRTINIPVKKLINFRKITLNNFSKLIDDASKKNDEKLRKYKNIEKKLEGKKKNINEISKLKQNKYIYEDIDIEKVVKFEYYETKKTCRYIENINSYIKFQDSRNSFKEIRGLSVEKEFEDKNILWEKEKNIKFISFLVKEYVDLNYKNNIKKDVKEIQKKYKTGVILSKFLISAVEDDKLIDFFKAYVEIIE
ncbi:MAG: MerR family transcriptional regulator [Psychrilyobacter sp.]|uniref:MerR family transcriptional regulator n=1 Tax=Psychrilyobacter sp. TaxID=2586924 RepID=UPI003C76411E